MKAVYITKHGGTEVMTYGEVSEPNGGPNDVKVRVRACALNRVDVFTRAGVRGTRINFNGPHVLGGDASGDVVEVGQEVRSVKVGDRVVVNPRLTCAQCIYCVGGESELCTDHGRLGLTTNGSYAEYVNVPAVNVVVLPETLSYTEAAALPSVFIPCWSMLIRRAGLKAWETVLVLSASSGVGSAAIQVAKNVIGSNVIATTSTDRKSDMARDLGADEVINYTTTDVTKRVKELTGGRGVEVVVDHVGADSWPSAYASLAMGGRYGICGVTSGYQVDFQMGLLFMRSQTILGVYMGRGEDLQQIVELAARGVVRSVIDEVFPLQDAVRAHRVMESRGFFGKLILSVS